MTVVVITTYEKHARRQTVTSINIDLLSFGHECKNVVQCDSKHANRKFLWIFYLRNGGHLIKTSTYFHTTFLAQNETPPGRNNLNNYHYPSVAPIGYVFLGLVNFVDIYLPQVMHELDAELLKCHEE